MTDYAAAAAAHLERATQDVNNSEGHGTSLAERAAMRLDIAREYVRLAAIEKGLPPGCACHAEDPDPAKITP
jgi:hypothetical protein